MPPAQYTAARSIRARPDAAGVVRLILLALGAAALLALAVHFAFYIRYAVAAVLYPFEIYDAEGIVWQQAMLIPGARMYGDIDRYPFIVFHYPPVYHLIVRALAELGADALIAGRAVSLLATLATAALVGDLAFRLVRDRTGETDVRDRTGETDVRDRTGGTDVRDRTGRAASLAGAAAAALVFLSFLPVVLMSPLMRVDTLAIALSFLGLRLAVRSARRARPPLAAMAVFVLAAFTKQTCVLAPLAVLAVLAAVHPRHALRSLVLGLLLGGAGLAAMTAATDGGFLRHLVLHNINRFNLSLAVDQIMGQSPQFLFVELALAGLIVLWYRLSGPGMWRSAASFRAALAADPGLQALAMVTIYLALSTASLLSLGKSGGGMNYFIEWMGVLSILIGALFAVVAHWQSAAAEGPAAGGRVADWRTMAAGFLVPVVMLAQVRILPASREPGTPYVVPLPQLEALVERVRNAPRPVLSEDMVLLMKAGKQVPWEPAIFKELALTGRWDERRLIRLIEDRHFAFVVTREAFTTAREDESPYTPGVAQAIAAAYPRTEANAGHILHLPPEE